MPLHDDSPDKLTTVYNYSATFEVNSFVDTGIYKYNFYLTKLSSLLLQFINKFATQMVSATDLAGPRPFRHTPTPLAGCADVRRSPKHHGVLC